MVTRRRIAGVVSSVISLAEVTSALASTALRILQDDDDDDRDSADFYGDAVLLSRPPRGADALFVDLDGERIVFGTKEPRWMVALEEGDAVLRALGASTRAYVRLKADGSIELVGSKITAGSTNATTRLALAELVADAINTAIASHGHPSFGAPGTALPPAPLVPPLITAEQLASTVFSSL